MLLKIRHLLVVLCLVVITPVFAQGPSIELIYNWQNQSLPGSLAFNNVYNEVWGFVEDGREYGVIGSTWGTHFFDVTDPENIFQVDSVEGAYTGGGVIHRDYHDYEGYLYTVCDEGAGQSTLQIIDLSTLPDSVTVVYDDLDKFTTAHNIFIDEVTGRLYVFIIYFDPGFSSFAIYDLNADPTDPQLLGIYNEGTQVHDGYVKNNIAYLNDGYNGRFLVMDCSDPDNIVTLGSLDSYPDLGYNHSGYLNESGDVYVFADENHGHVMKVCDVSDLTDINVLSTISSEVDAMSIPHNQIIKGDYLYTAYYHDGLFIHDISDPANPQYVADYKTYALSDHTSYRGAWGVYPFLPSGLVLVSDMQYGFFVMKVENLFSGDDEIELLPFKVQDIYPNPVSDYFVMQISAAENQSGEVLLYNLQGVLLKKIDVQLQVGENSIRFELPEAITSGMYMVKFETEKRSFTEQLVKIEQH